ncbi:MAG: glycosyltransferase family 2 protein [Anaerolineae bacterium]|nr:glycosyltransferase family 2 protein [Anaerolineae bacterium]
MTVQPHTPPGSLHDTTSPALSVVLPAYNEVDGLRPVLESLLPEAAARNWEVLVIDDGSTDGTGDLVDAIASEHPATLRPIHHRRNRGYGAALKTGFRHARAPLVASMDSDGQHTVDQLLTLLPQAGSHDMIIGQRMGLVHSPLWRMPGKWLLGIMANFLAQEHIPDLNSGLRVFHSDVIRRYLHLCPDGFSFSTTSTLVLLNRGYAVGYTPIRVQPRQGKSTVSLRTGFDTILLILRLSMLLAPLRIFLPISAILFTAGTVWAIPYLIARQGLTVAALLLLITGLLIFLVGLLADQVAALRKEQFEDTF